MHLKSLRVFCDVVGRRSFSRAASENGITQSGASQLVHHLEEYLGVKLIDRSKRPFVLTPEGEVYYEGCRGLVQQLYALEDEVRSLRQEVEGRVSVVSIYSIGLSHMNRCVHDFLNKHPRANVRVEYQHPQQVVELVESGQMDLGLISYPKQTRTLKAIPWRDEVMVVVCAPSHPLAGATSLTLEQLDGREMVGLDGGLTIRREIDRELSAKGVSVRVVMEFDNIETLKRAVEINAGLSLLPEPTVAREVEFGSLVAVPLAGVRMVRPLGILHRCGADLGATARRFIQFLLDHPKADEWTSDRATSAARMEGPVPLAPETGRAEHVKT
ncbi:MAG: LysR family transcriptional regulator [Pirellulaceae bacterium]